MSVKDTFIKLTKTTIPSGQEKIIEPLLPKGYKKDFHGNYYIKIGDSSVMFTSHCDTADPGQPKEVTHVFEGDIIKTDNKTILGADDKAGMAIMYHMIENKVPGLYYFFLSEEHGCVGSRALNDYLVGKGKDDPIFKKIDKVIAFDRRDYDSVITYQVGERCCSDEFADELAKRLNEAGGFKYRKDTSGAVTDSHQVADRFSECTNLSVGYKDQHSTRETQDITFLTKLAEACTKIDWDTLPAKRDKTKTEHLYSRSYNNNRNVYRGGEWDDTSWWVKNRNGYNPTSNSNLGPKQLPKGQEYVNDYLGKKVKVSDCVWCEHDKVYCLKDKALWIDYIGFYTCPDYDPSKVVKEPLFDDDTDAGEYKDLAESDFKEGLKIYQKGKLFGTITQLTPKGATIATEKGSKFMCPIDKIVSTYKLQIKNEAGGKSLTRADLKVGISVVHPSFGKGKITSFRADKSIVTVKFTEKGEKDLHMEVANMKF